MPLRFFAGDEGGGSLPRGHFWAACFVLIAVIVFAYQFSELFIKPLHDSELCLPE